MSQPPVALDARLQRIQKARDAFFSRGEAPHGLLERALVRSWERCRQAGLESAAPESGGNIIEGHLLAQAQERCNALVRHARSIMEHMHEQIRHTGSIVLLSNEQGLLLHSVGDADFIERAGRIALQPGANWEEGIRGTNAVGTAIAERSPVEVIGGEHFLERHMFLTCSAVPLVDPHGELLGVLDISGDARSYQRHTLGLARMSASLVEKRLFEAEFAGELLLCFHTRPEYVGSIGEGVAAVAQDGRILAINASGLDILGLRRDEATRCHCSMLFETSLGMLIDRARRDPGALNVFTLLNGAQLYVQLRGNLPPPAVAPRFGNAAPLRGSRPRLPAVDENRTPALTLDSLATGDPRLQLSIDRARRVLGRDIPILIQGESGAGKEMFAKAIHNSGPRGSGPFVALNCAAIPENLIESELFGYQGGAFTGARKEGAVGKIQQAHGGTLFLDEIGDMPLALQARLLRVLQERCVTPLGGNRTVPVDISLVCATHRHLKEEVARRTFREDLYYRLNGLSVTLPPLRDRTDLQRLVEILIGNESDGRPIHLSESAMQAFAHYDWPGNIRQLNNVIRVAIALLDDEETVITEAQLPEELIEHSQLHGGASLSASAPQPHTAPVRATATAIPPAASPAPAQADAPPPYSTEAGSLEEIERRAIQQALEAHGGNISAAARMLGVSRNTLYRKLGRL